MLGSIIAFWIVCGIFAAAIILISDTKKTQDKDAMDALSILAPLLPAVAGGCLSLYLTISSELEKEGSFMLTFIKRIKGQ